MQSRKRAQETTSFVTIQRQAGKSFVYQPLVLPLNGPPIPSYEDLESLGYLQHIKKPSPVFTTFKTVEDWYFQHRLAGGFTVHTGCLRALFESRIDLYAC